MGRSPEPPVYGQSTRYKTSVWLLWLGHLALAAEVLLMTLLVMFPRAGARIYPPRWFIVAFLAFFGLAFVVITTSAILGELMRCQACGGRPLDPWMGRLRLTEWQALKARFQRPPRRSDRFRCHTCGAESRLG